MATDLFLLDTQIWVDHYLKRGPEGVYGEMALKLILKLIADDAKIIFSNYHEKELKQIGFSQMEIDALLLMIKPDHIKRVSITKEQFKEAHKIAKQRDVPLGDVIHAVVARDTNAQLVTRDEKDFRKLKDVTVYKEPNNLL